MAMMMGGGFCILAWGVGIGMEGRWRLGGEESESESESGCLVDAGECQSADTAGAHILTIELIGTRD